MSSSDARPPGARLPLSSITREVPASELAALVDKTRPRDDTPRAQEEADTAAMGGEEIDALLAPERSAPSSPNVTAPMPPVEAPPISVLPPGAARMVVPPTHVPLAPVPSRLSEPTVVLTADLFPTAPAAPKITAPQTAPTFGAPPAAPTFGAPPPTFGAPPAPAAPAPSFGAAPAPASSRADVPVWAQTQLAPSRRQVRAARNTKLFLGVAALALLTGSAGAAFVMLRKGPGGTAGPSGVSGAPSETSNVPSETLGSSSETGSVPSGTGNRPSETGNRPSETSGAPPAPPGTPEFEAKEALSRLREGLGTCVRDVIHVLPGTSPAVPEKLAALRGGAYKSAARDYRSPVFSCLKYRESKPQRFQIQWQVTMQPSEGRGVAWLDDDGDGKADRALSFRAVLVRRGEVELGEIRPLTPVPDVSKPRP
ncbi:MAG: hypothetical protein U0441_36525 [Polyangiaceae bacterium]